MLSLMVLAVHRGASAAEHELRWIKSDQASSTSAAVVVGAELPLAHTAQLWPVDSQGNVVAPGHAEPQSQLAIDRLEAALRETGSDLGDLVRLNVYAARAEVVPVFRAAFGRRAAGKGRPAVTYVVGDLARRDAVLALDAVAVARMRKPPPPSGNAAPAIARFGSRVAVMPAGARFFISGQAEPGASLAESTRRTLKSLGATLRYLRLDLSRVVQVKAFFQPIQSAGDVEKQIADFFDASGLPPVILVEWRARQPIEIELVASGRGGEGDGAIAFLTPPGLKASPVFSRVARVGRSPLVYISGQYGTAGTGGAGEVESIFDSLRTVLAEAGSDFRHMAKATYYVSDPDVSRALNELRPRYYDPARPPAASKIDVTGVGVAGRSITLDMIAVPAAPGGAGPPECGRGLDPQAAGEGWLSLFDGTTDRGWRGASVTSGLLSGGQTTTDFGPCAVRAVLETGGTVSAGGTDYRLSAGPWALATTRGTGTIRLKEGASIRELAVRPLGLASILPTDGLAGWQQISHPRPRPGIAPIWHVADGALRVSGGPGALEYRTPIFGDMVLQVRARTRSRYSNSGVFFRSQPGAYLLGYEAQIYNRCENDNPDEPSLYATGAIDDRQNAWRLVSRDFQPFTLTVIARGPHLATWVNGRQVTDWTDRRPPHENPRSGRRVEPGTIQLQAHDAATDLEILGISVAPLAPDETARATIPDD
jgi:enamine deaminase RidA (YjgF/YER057c/UK114 family)